MQVITNSLNEFSFIMQKKVNKYLSSTEKPMKTFRPSGIKVFICGSLTFSVKSISSKYTKVNNPVKSMTWSHVQSN